MFKFLKEKIGSFFRKEALKDEKDSKAKKEKRNEVNAASQHSLTKKKTKEKKPKKENGIEQKLKEKADAIEEEVPTKFDSGKLKYEPDLEGLKEKKEELISHPSAQDESDEELIEKEDLEYQREKKEIVEEKKQKKIEKPKEKKGFFSRLAEKLTSSELKEEEFNEFFDEFEMTLLENNVALEVVDEFRKILFSELIGKRFKEKEVGEKIKDALRKAIDEVLIEGEDLIEKIKKKEGTFVILFFGINGSGKTTSIAKLAYKLKREKISCVLGAGDTFRAASIEQLEKHAEMLGVPIVKKNYQSDPAAVAFDTIAYARKNRIKVALIDTAGRMYTKANLLNEMEKIARVAKPDLKIFVGESITGNDAVEQAKKFNETVGIDGIILSKADVDEKAGAILSVSFVTKKPILFLGTGQRYEELKVFTKHDVMKGLGLE